MRKFNVHALCAALLAAVSASCIEEAEDGPIEDDGAQTASDTFEVPDDTPVTAETTLPMSPGPYLLTPAEYQARFNSYIASYDAHPTDNQLVWGTNDVLQSEVVAYQATGNIGYLLAAYDQMEVLLLRTSYRANITEYLTGTKKYVWLSTHYSCGKPVATVLGDSLIVAPMADAIYEGLRHASQLDASRVTRIKYFVLILDAAMSFHDSELRVNTLGQGYYIIPSYYAKITGCAAWAGLSGNIGRYLPVNQESQPGLANIAMWRLYRDIPGVQNATKAAEYRTRALQLITWVKAQMRGVNGTLQWSYWPGPNNAAEDLSHAVLTVNFMMSAYNDGLSSAYLSGLRNTFLARYSSNPRYIAERVDGSGTLGLSTNAEALSRWARILRYDRTLGPYVAAIYNNTTYVDQNARAMKRQITAGAYYELYGN